MQKVVLENINVRFGMKEIFNGLNMEIAENEFVCVVSESPWRNRKKLCYINGSDGEE